MSAHFPAIFATVPAAFPLSATVTRSAMPSLSDWQRIAQEVADKHGVTLADMVSAKRFHELVVARQEAMWRCRQETSMSMPQIGRRFGGRDHTTVLHSIRVHEKRMAAL